MYISKLSYLDISIIVLYLLITIVVGVYYRAENVNIIDYAIAKKQLSYPILLFSSLATIIAAGSTVGTISEIYKLGVIFIIPNFGYVLGSFLFAKFIAIKIDNRFNNNISASDIIKIFYGKNASIVTAIIGFSYCTGIAGVQITALGHIFNSLLGMQYEMGVIIGGLIIVVYSCTRWI